ncbi:mandelate racemase/muconate lactonizing enzyme family protein [Kitasatospora kifunensis]
MLALTDKDGVTGYGECSDAGPVATVVERLRAWAAGAPAPGDFTGRTVGGALAQALADQAARRAARPLWSWYGGADRRPVPVYANINRVPGGRTPAEVARAAEDAAAAGHHTVKLAPFDVPGTGEELGRLGLRRVRAARAAIGPGPQLLVDCHERLPLRQLSELLEELADAGVGWLEDGVGIERPAELRLLRARTHLPLAGGEFAHDPAQLEPVDGLLDVLLPDVKHAGGPEAVRALARAAGTARVSLHNPSGPVAALHSAHLTVALDGDLLECAVGEVPWRAELVGGGERIERGEFLLPTGPGLGADFDATHPRSTLLWSATTSTSTTTAASASPVARTPEPENAR